jgi:hypothetical protein
MPEEGGAQAPALRDRVDSDHRQKPHARRVVLSHLLEHGGEVAGDVTAVALGGQLPERCLIGFDAGGEPQGDRGEVLQYVRRAVVERSPAIGLGDPWPVGGVLVCVRPGPARERVAGERKGERGDPTPPVRRRDDLH